MMPCNQRAVALSRGVCPPQNSRHRRDLSLTGRPLFGHFDCGETEPHGQLANGAHWCARRCASPSSPRSLRTAGKPAPKGSEDPKADLLQIMDEKGALDSMQIMKILPLAIRLSWWDRVTRIDGNKITAIKTHAQRTLFQDIFLVSDHARRAAIGSDGAGRGIFDAAPRRKFRANRHFMAADDVRWRKPVIPGDTCSSKRVDQRCAATFAKPRCLQGRDEVVSEAEITFIGGRCVATFMIHKTAVVHPKAHRCRLPDRGRIGVIGRKRGPGSSCRLHSHIVMTPHAARQKDTKSFLRQHRTQTQDSEMERRRHATEIATTKFRDTSPSTAPRRRRSHGLLHNHILAYCQSRTTPRSATTSCRNVATLAGHGTVEDHAVIGGLARCISSAASAGWR